MKHLRLGIILAALVACTAIPLAMLSTSRTVPNLPAGETLAPGVKCSEVKLYREGVRSPMRLWVYLPDPLPTAKLPCILIAPAGSRMFHGMALADGDRAEHLPYVKRDFAVIAYEIDGPLPDRPNDSRARAALQAFC